MAARCSFSGTLPYTQIWSIEDSTSWVFRILGAFRHHQSQFSNSDGPSYSAGLFEWEYLLRWGADRGHLGDDTYLPAIARIVHEMYRPSVHRFPELQRFIDLSGRGEAGKYLSPEYLEALENARAAVDARTKSGS